jgi:hypothetical protein
LASVLAASGNEVQDLAFPGGQLRERGRGDRWSSEVGEQGGDAGAEDGLAGGHGHDRPGDLLLFGAFEDIATGTGAHGREHPVVVVEHGQDQHCR